MYGLVVLLLLPPTNLVLFGIAGLILSKWWRRAGLTVTAVSLVLLLLLSLPVVGGSLITLLEQGLPVEPEPGQPPQAIVVLSAETDHVLGPGPHLVVGSLTLERERAAAALWRRTKLPLLVSGGVLKHDDIAVATLMANSLKNDFGVPVQWVEDRSETTWQNAQDSAAILLPQGIRSVYVVTHAWHEKRALLAFRHFGFQPTAAVVQFDDPQGGIQPETRAWSLSYYGIHEWVGLLWYWLRVQLAQSNRAA